MAYADYYERAHTNGVMGIQRGTDPGKMIYMLPLGQGSSKATSFHGWGTPFDSFWCCYGTGKIMNLIPLCLIFTFLVSGLSEFRKEIAVVMQLMLLKTIFFSIMLFFIILILYLS